MKFDPPGIEKSPVAGDRRPGGGYPEGVASLEDTTMNLTLAKNTTDLIFRFQLQPYPILTFVSPSCLRFTGYTQEEFYADPELLQQLVHPKDTELFENFKKLDIGDKADSATLRWIHKDSTVIWTEQSRTVSHNEDGEPVAFYVIVRDVTEHRKTAEALKASEEMFSKVFQASPNPICIISIENETFLDVNESFIRSTGFAREEVIGHTSVELGLWTNEDDLKTMRCVLQQKGKIFNQEFNGRTKSGEIRTYLFSAELVAIDGKMCMVLVITDITESKWAEQTLRESEEFTTSLLNNNPNPLLVTYLDGSIKYVNPAFEKLTGFPLTEIIGSKKPYPWWPEGKQEEITASFREMQSSGIKPEMAYSKRNGERFWVELSLASIKNNGERKYILVNWVDITARKQMELALRESEDKFYRAFNASPSIMAITAQNGTYTEVNESFCRVSGYSREELIGRKSRELNIWATAEERARYIEKINEQGQIHNEEFVFRRKSGELQTLLFSAEPINIGGEQCVISVGNDITERKLAEKSLQESEEKFSRAFSCASDAMAIVSSRGGKFLEVNDKYVRFSGYTREELIARNADELNMWGDPADRQKILHLTAEKGRLIHEEFSFRMKSGGIRTCLFSGESFNIRGERRMVIVIQDITERKQAETALRESEEKFSKIFRASANAIAIFSLNDNCFIEANESFTRFTGYSLDEVIGHNAAELNLWIDSGEKQRSVDELRKSGRVYNHEFNSRCKSGEVRVGLSSIELINIGGQPCRMVVITDITERKKAEERLSLLSSVTQQVTDSTIVTDPDFKITYMNKAAQDLFGYSIDEARGTDVSQFNVVPLSGDYLREMKTTLTAGKTSTGLLTKRRKDGSTFLCDCRRSPLFDENGRLTSYIIVHRDVTEQKEIEAKLKAHKQLIESILTSMLEGVLVTDTSDTVVLANEAFRRIFQTGKKPVENRLLSETIHAEQFTALYNSMKKGNPENNGMEFRYKIKNQEKIIACRIIKMDGGRMLITFTDISRVREEEDKLYLMDRLASLGEMAAGLAHELNNPLTGILALSQLLVNSDVPEQQKEDLQCINIEAKRAASIVKNVLLFTRNNNYENGQSSVNEVVKEVLRLREHEAKTSNIKVVTNLQDNLPEIALDKYQLQQVFLNIILNAEAAMKNTKRPGTLTVETERVNKHVHIMFSDTGCGIKKDVLPRIFDPFFTTKEIGKGTGLGLSICYGIIVKHNGKISVQTHVGKGTTFTIRMPVVN